MEMSLKDQMDLNIDKKRIDRKVYQMEVKAQERMKEMKKKRSKFKQYQDRIKQRAADMEKSLFSK